MREHWTCTVTDANSCVASVNFTITEPTALTTTANDQTNVACNGEADGAASVSVSGGTADYTYDWTGTPNGDGTASVTGLSAGAISCTVTDGNGCTATVNFTITEPSALTAAVANTQTNVACNGGKRRTSQCLCFRRYDSLYLRLGRNTQRRRYSIGYRPCSRSDLLHGNRC